MSENGNRIITRQNEISARQERNRRARNATVGELEDATNAAIEANMGPGSPLANILEMMRLRVEALEATVKSMQPEPEA